MPRATRTFRIFVSSTFEDMAAERNALQTEVFPRLHQLCAEHDARFQAIDLRWGVRDEAGLDQQTMSVCFSELARCQAVTPRPNFLVLLGDRYGWRPAPAEVPADEFERIHAAVIDAEAAAALDTWYRRDDNAQLEPGSAQLARDAHAAPQAVYLLQPRDPDGPYGTSADENDRSAKRAAWTEVERTLQRTLAEGARALALPRERLLLYTGSATHQEIAAGLLDVPGAEEHVFAFSRIVDDLPGRPLPEKKSHHVYIDPVYGPGNAGQRQVLGHDEEAAGLLKELKETLRERLGSHFVQYRATWLGYDDIAGPEGGEGALTAPSGGPGAAQSEAPGPVRPPISLDHLEQLCADVYDSLSTIILQECERLEAVDQEKSVHDFAQDRSRNFVGRADTLARIESYLLEGADQPLVLWGESGTGKSAVMARVMLAAEKTQPSAEVVCRFIGATPGSSDVRSLLDDVSRKIDSTYHPEVPDAGTSYEDLVKSFPTRLAAATPDKPLIVMLDALDQLSDANNARSLTWLPTRVPENCRIVVSTTPGDCKSALQRMLREERLLQLTEMTKEDGEELLGLWLADAQRTLQDSQRWAVMDRFLDAPIPLYLKLAFEEARRWHSYDHLDDPFADLAPEVAGLIADLYDRLALPQNHGELLVERSLSYLAASRYGLSEEELLGVLCQDDEFFAKFATEAHHDLPGIKAGVPLAVADLPAPAERSLPVAVWSRLYYDLEPYLGERDEEGAHVLTFYHRQLREVAASRYLAEEGWRIDKQTPLTGVGKARHQILADYFGRLADPEPPDDEGFHSWSGEYRRAFAELPYHLTMAGDWDHVYDALTDFTFLERKAVKVAVDERADKDGSLRTVYNGPNFLHDDYQFALAGMGGDSPTDRKPLIVTGTDLGHGMMIRCPWCNTSSPFKEEYRGQDIPCPNPECGGPLRVNTFVVGPPPRIGASPAG
ncbi:MAG: DUF4062 domain-containing protein [Thermoleophilia bacterium]|nr:DUF4062 domain-containing protein [Thermoleophilia bacterium]